MTRARSASTRRSRAALAALLVLASCASLMPNTAEAIQPATLDDLLVGFMADVEQWIAWATAAWVGLGW